MPLTGDFVVRRGLDKQRYTYTNGDDIYDTLCGYYVSLSYFEQLLAEGRSDSARHSFRYVDRPPVNLGQGWYFKHVKCDRCGEAREIGISVEQLNRQERWCFPRRTLFGWMFGA